MNYFNQTKKYEIAPCSHHSAQEMKHDSRPLPTLLPCLLHLDFVLLRCSSLYLYYTDVHVSVPRPTQVCVSDLSPSRLSEVIWTDYAL